MLNAYLGDFRARRDNRAARGAGEFHRVASARNDRRAAPGDRLHALLARKRGGEPPGVLREDAKKRALGREPGQRVERRRSTDDGPGPQQDVIVGDLPGVSNRSRRNHDGRALGRSRADDVRQAGHGARIRALRMVRR